MSSEVAGRKFLDLQNKYRGLIADFRARRFEKDEKTPTSKQYRHKLSRWLLDARSELEPSQFSEMLAWFAELSASQLTALNQTPVGYEELSGVHVRAPTTSLEREIRWIRARINIEAEKLAIFRAAAELTEALVTIGKYDEAITVLGTLQEAVGVSFWSVQLRIALEHLAGGLERQKRYTGEVRGVYKRGLLGFVSYHTSVRNEDRTTLNKFLDDIESRISKHPYYEEDTKAYVRYRLKGEVSDAKDSIAKVLKVEQSHGIIDLYETFVVVLQHLAKINLDESLNAAVLESISDWPIQDFRIEKLAQLYDLKTLEETPARPHDISDRLFAGKVAAAAGLSRRADPARFLDPWHYIYGGFIYSHFRGGRDFPSVTPVNLVPALGHVLKRSNFADEAWAQSTKLALNLKTLPYASGLLEFLVQCRRDRADNEWRPWLIGLHSPTAGPEDIPCHKTRHDVSDWRGETAEFWRETILPTDAETPAASIAKALGYVHRGDFEQALSTLDHKPNTWPDALGSMRPLLELHAHYALAQRGSVIALIAGEGSKSPAHAAFLPIGHALKDYDWSDYTSVDRPLAAPIALHLFWTGRENSVVASRMRFSTGVAIRRAGVAKPSDLTAAQIEVSSHELIYFLRHLCIPDILDIARLFPSSRELLAERQDICAALMLMDPARAEMYEAELVLIANNLALDEGRWIVDSSRIHVDSDGLVRWAVKQLSEDYDRYRDLVAVNISDTQTFDDVLRELEAQPAQRAAFVPDNEADAVLVSIMRRLAEEFLGNSTFGLDFYLSKRVRHQSFIGLIRGPLEFSDLITTRETEAGEYHRNATWIDKFDVKVRDEADLAFRKFAQHFDETLGHAKDSYLHIRSADHPLGMIVLILDDRLIRLARGVIRLDFTFREFLSVAVSIFWAAIEPSLVQIRNLIAEEVKAEIAQGFDLVRADIRALAEHDAAFLEYDAAMGRVSTEVQVKLDEAAQWFVHADTLKHRRTFTIEQMLDIGIQTALKTQRGYDPIINTCATGEIRLLPPDLVFVYDVLFVGLGNAHKHSGLKTPTIDVAGRYDEQTDTLQIEVISDCRPSHKAQRERQVANVREAIERGTFLPRTRREGESGFAKLAAVVNQSEKGALEFGFTPDGRFRLAVTYSVVFRNYVS